MIRRCIRWLLGDPIHVVKVTSVVQQDDPAEYFFTTKVVIHPEDMSKKFDLVFSLAMVVSMHGETFIDRDGPFTHIYMVDGQEDYVMTNQT